MYDVTLSLGIVKHALRANGAGKSTLLATVSGLLRPWKGEVLLAGRHIVVSGPGAELLDRSEVRAAYLGE